MLHNEILPYDHCVIRPALLRPQFLVHKKPFPVIFLFENPVVPSSSLRMFAPKSSHIQIFSKLLLSLDNDRLM